MLRIRWVVIGGVVLLCVVPFLRVPGSKGTEGLRDTNATFENEPSNLPSAKVTSDMRPVVGEGSEAVHDLHQESPPDLAYTTRAGAKSNGALQVIVKGHERGAGDLHFALFASPAGFPDQSAAVMTRTISGESEGVTARFDGLAPGEYALAAYQDRDGNRQLSKGAFGIPSEPYGFSRNARGTFGPPSFSQAKFSVSESGTQLQVMVR